MLPQSGYFIVKCLNNCVLQWDIVLLGVLSRLNIPTGRLFHPKTLNIGILQLNIVLVEFQTDLTFAHGGYSIVKLLKKDVYRFLLPCNLLQKITGHMAAL